MDIVIGAEGPAADDAHAAAWWRFETLLDELVAELPLLRQAVGDECPLRGGVARRMWLACAPFAPFASGFITPMAAVAGAVAQELIASYQRPGIDRAWVNNGGDIALHLAAGAGLRIGVVADLARIKLDGKLAIHATDPVRGVATSGWRGRSFTLGIADSVTVLARTAAMADAAATVIANAVNIDDAHIQRRPACEVQDNSDLGPRLVTVHVPPLHESQVRQALENGMARAQELREHGLIESALLACQGQFTSTASTATHPFCESLFL
jgi:uncharacterized protein